MADFVGTTKPWTCNLCGLQWQMNELPPCNHTDEEWDAWGQANGHAPGLIPRWTPTPFPPAPESA